ncbi:MAG: hypothetical protein ACR9NN_24485 [Nostochopsis sp.]
MVIFDTAIIIIEFWHSSLIAHEEGLYVWRSQNTYVNTLIYL